MGTRRITIGVGSADVSLPPRSPDPHVTLDLDPRHPSAHGVLRLTLDLDGDVVVAAEPHVGHLHRGAEKLFEVRDYRQVLVLANRHDWHAAFPGELGVALAVERMLGMEVPRRATLLRTLLAELTRVTSHLAFLGPLPGDDEGAADRAAADARELVLRLFEEIAGARMHLMLVQVGGLKVDAPDGWLDRVRATTARVRSSLAMVDALLGTEAFVGRTRGVGVLTRADAVRLGCSGPVARASGLDLDLRRDEPYLAYADLGRALRVVTREEGDALARLEVLADQVRVSLELVDACADLLEHEGPGPVALPLPKVLKAPEGHTYCWTENPCGIAGYLLVSRGEKTPWRLKIRSASFPHVAALGELLPGTRLVDLLTVLTSLFYVVGDVDK